MTDTLIHDYLKNHSYITLDHYMQLCLQHDTKGYYQTGHPIGTQGDFITAPEISQIFGELIGVFIKFHLETLFTDHYQICELGAGRGTLALDYLRILKNNPPENIFFLETNQHLKKQQLHNIPNAQHINTLDQLPKKPTLFLANEFFDALPIKAFKIFGAEKSEIIIKQDNHNGFEFDYAPAVKNTTNQITGFYETSPVTLDFCSAISDHIKENQGAFLLCDYGYDAPLKHLTFRGFKNHIVTDGLQAPCQEDLTADVNFTAIMNYFHDQNLTVSNLCTQADFLQALHIDKRLHQLLGKLFDKKPKEDLIKGVQKLISPLQMGTRFKFLNIHNNTASLYPFSSHYQPPSK